MAARGVHINISVCLACLFRMLTCFELNETLVNDIDLSRELLPMARTRRSLSSLDFKKLQANWKFSKEEIEKMFEDYYECITENNKPENRVNNAITAVLALEGQRVELKCPVCHRPDQTSDYHRMFWQRIRLADSTTVHINPKAKGIKILPDMTLIIKNIDITDAGQYFCILAGDPEIIYQVDVVFKEPLQSISENNTEDLLPALQLEDHNIEVYSHWSDWGECDQCDKSGQRLKFGTCMLQKIDKSKRIKPADIPIISSYPKGVPCRSTVVPRAVTQLEGIKGRKSEVIKGFCFVPCPTNPPSIEVTDRYGNVIEVIETGYHPLDRKPELPPLVIRQIQYKPVGFHLILTCPTSNSGKVRWQRGERAINSATIGEQTRGRVTVDKLNRLHIRKLNPEDVAPYNCWVWQKHIATIKVLVYEPLSDDFKHYITYGGLFLTVISIPLYCLCKICCAKPRRHKK